MLICVVVHEISSLFLLTLQQTHAAHYFQIHFFPPPSAGTSTAASTARLPQHSALPADNDNATIVNLEAMNMSRAAVQNHRWRPANLIPNFTFGKIRLVTARDTQPFTNRPPCVPYAPEQHVTVERMAPDQWPRGGFTEMTCTKIRC